MEYVKYAYGIVIAAGLSVTGVLWYERANSPYVRAEDIAALAAGVQERYAFAGHVEGHDIDMPSNAITPVIAMTGSFTYFDEKIQIYHDILYPLRDMAMWRPATYRTIGIFPFWMDASANTPGHGDAIISADTYPYIEEEYTADDGVTYRVWDVAFSNRYELFNSSTSIMVDDGAGIYYWSALMGAGNAIILAGTNEAGFGQAFDIPSTVLTNTPYDGGNWWTEQGLGTNVFAWDVEGRTNYLVNYAIKTSTLYQARAVLNGLTRSAAVVWPDAVSCTNATQEYYDMNTWPTFVLDSVTNIQSGTFFLYDDKVVDVSAQHTRREITNPDATNETTGGYAFVRRYTGCTLPYPSSAACASGKVSRVSIYVICYSTDVMYTDHDTTYGTSWEEVSYTGIPIDFNAGDSVTYGVVDFLSPYPPLEQSLENNSTEWDYFGQLGGYAFSKPPHTVVVNLIGSWDNPSARPSFDFGCPAFSFDDSNAGGYDLVWQTGEPPDQRILTKTRRLYEGGVAVYCFLVIVDWNWEYP